MIYVISRAYFNKLLHGTKLKGKTIIRGCGDLKGVIEYLSKSEGILGGISELHIEG